VTRAGEEPEPDRGESAGEASDLDLDLDLDLERQRPLPHRGGKSPGSMSASADVVLLVDVSTSMESFVPALVDGVSRYLEGIRSLDAPDNPIQRDAHVEVRLFASSASVVLSKPAGLVTDADVTECVRLIRADGQTRLYDTITEAVRSQRERFETKQAECVGIQGADWSGMVLSVLTDGRDTCSTISDAEEVKKLVGSYREKMGQFVWLQANLDALVESAAFGGGSGQSLQVGTNPGDIGRALTSLTRATTRYCESREQARAGASSASLSSLPCDGPLEVVTPRFADTRQLTFTALERAASCGAEPSPQEQAVQVSGLDGYGFARPPGPLEHHLTESAVVRPPSRW
jgi:hypothetical protein